MRTGLSLFFSDVFEVDEETLEEYGAFNVSLITDLPLFIDPFLLFGSEKPEYQVLHGQIIKYLRFLKTRSEAGQLTRGLMAAWYCFGEVRENWLGFCRSGNSGRGLGKDFAGALNEGLASIFSNFGTETITQGSHLEKLCLIKTGVGRDMISDFTTNLIKEYLLDYTARFAQAYIAPSHRGKFAVQKVRFDYERQCWLPRTFELPAYRGDYVLLTPKDILTKDDTWISHSDMMHRFEDIPTAIADAALRDQVNNYLSGVLSGMKEPTEKDYEKAFASTLRKFPELADYYIRQKEDTGDEARANSALKVAESQSLYIANFGALANMLGSHTAFYSVPGNTYEEAQQRVAFFKDIVENKGGHRLFYVGGKHPKSEKDIQILFCLVWYGTPSDVSREVNDGRGPADFKVSRGAKDKTIVEFKLAGNTQLKRNLERQTEIYQKASNAAHGIKVIIFFDDAELQRVRSILQDLHMADSPDVVLIDARMDNKPSASKA